MPDEQMRRIQELLDQVDQVCAESERIRRTIELRARGQHEYPPTDATAGLTDGDGGSPLPKGPAD